MELLIILLILVAILVAVARSLTKAPEHKGSTKFKELLTRLVDPDEDDDQSSDHPYHKKDRFLTRAERSFYGVLTTLADTRGWDVFAKVRLEDVVEVERGADQYQAHRNRIKARHLDFLLCDAQTVSPVLAIELNDSSHLRDAQQLRDEFVTEVLKAADLPLLFVPAQRGYSIAELSGLIGRRLGEDRVAQPSACAPATEQEAAEDLAVPGHCPRCGSRLVERRSRSTGEPFWGCSEYPACHHTQPM